MVRPSSDENCIEDDHGTRWHNIEESAEVELIETAEDTKPLTLIDLQDGDRFKFVDCHQYNAAGICIKVETLPHGQITPREQHVRVELDRENPNTHKPQTGCYFIDSQVELVESKKGLGPMENLVDEKPMKYIAFFGKKGTQDVLEADTIEALQELVKEDFLARAKKSDEAGYQVFQRIAPFKMTVEPKLTVVEAPTEEKPLTLGDVKVGRSFRFVKETPGAFGRHGVCKKLRYPRSQEYSDNMKTLISHIKVEETKEILDVSNKEEVVLEPKPPVKAQEKKKPVKKEKDNG